jgi:hypothetical protein
VLYIPQHTRQQRGSSTRRDKIITGQPGAVSPTANTLNYLDIKTVVRKPYRYDQLYMNGQDIPRLPHHRHP